ncbi:putative disease resistance RPP13-like protein 1-like [Capsicum annuum]|uniref:NB-ARC domain-containing protein n=1 Tax=Capsicum annuum TaxID=4072 RepID=A0A2G2YGW1_CAPAN|nr:putative disease resistance RPP13-like protein 1-like [Capsicum annuum]PHT68993.1 hypothetical protein T459_28480 [Capsicum annuum]
MVYSDSDWAGDPVDRTSTTGYVIYLGKTNWITNLLRELHFSLACILRILCDNIGTTYIGENPVFHKNKQASNRHVSKWHNKLQSAVDGAENLIEEVNYEALRLKEKLEDTIETLEDLQKQIGLLGLKEHFGSTKQETKRPSNSLIDESDVFGRENEIEDLIDLLLFEDANGENLTVVPIVRMGSLGKTTLAKAVYNDERVIDHFDLKAWFCVSKQYDALRITKGLLQEIRLVVDDNFNQQQVKLKKA